MPKARCYLCKSVKHKTLYRIDSYRINKCDKCNFVFTSPVPSDRKLNKFYSKFDKNIEEKDNIIIDDTIKSLDWIANIIIKTQGLKLLDIGCGKGHLLDLSEIYKFIPTGLDISNKYRRRITKILKINFIHEDILNFRTKNKYDIICLNQVIEHFKNPIDLIKKCYSLLNKDGYLFIATPNISSQTHEYRKIKFDYLIPPEHLSYFDVKTLSLLLTKYKFNIVNVDSWSYPFDLAGIIKENFLGSPYNIKAKIPKKVTKLSIYKEIQSKIKLIKHILFDKIFCNLFYWIVLSEENKGTMIQILAKKG